MERALPLQPSPRTPVGRLAIVLAAVAACAIALAVSPGLLFVAPLLFLIAGLIVRRQHPVEGNILLGCAAALAVVWIAMAFVVNTSQSSQGKAGQPIRVR